MKKVTSILGFSWFSMCFPRPQRVSHGVPSREVAGKTCRCLPWSAVEAIWKTMDTGHRLQLEVGNSIE